MPRGCVLYMSCIGWVGELEDDSGPGWRQASFEASRSAEASLRGALQRRITMRGIHSEVSVSAANGEGSVPSMLVPSAPLVKELSLIGDGLEAEMP